MQLFVERARAAAAGLRADRGARAGGGGTSAVASTASRSRSSSRPPRTRSLSVEQIDARLGDRFRLLTGGARTALPRQQTLRATLDWSYDLLAEAERVVLRRLAVFPGSFAIEAASAVRPIQASTSSR